MEKLIYWYKMGYHKTREALAEIDYPGKESVLLSFEEAFNALIEKCYDNIRKYYKNEYLNREETLI